MLRAIGLALRSTEGVFQSSANARGNYGQELIDAQQQSKSGNDKNAFEAQDSRRT
jgi:hypothetical protein